MRYWLEAGGHQPLRRGPRAIFNEIVETLFVVVYAAFGMTRRKTRIRAV
jgi:hypothetical protein